MKNPKTCLFTSSLMLQILKKQILCREVFGGTIAWGHFDTVDRTQIVLLVLCIP